MAGILLWDEDCLNVWYSFRNFNLFIYFLIYASKTSGYQCGHIVMSLLKLSLVGILRNSLDMIHIKNEIKYAETDTIKECKVGAEWAITGYHFRCSLP